MSTSDELRSALNRRLQRIDSAGPRRESGPRDDGRDRTPDVKDNQNIFRSGWSNTPPLGRATMLPPAPDDPPIPLKAADKSGRVSVIISKFSPFM